KPMTLTRYSGNCRPLLSKDSLCICGVNFSADLPSPPNEPVAPRKLRNTSTRFSLTCATLPTSLSPSNGERIPKLPSTTESPAEPVTSPDASLHASQRSTVSDPVICRFQLLDQILWYFQGVVRSNVLRERRRQITDTNHSKKPENENNS